MTRAFDKHSLHEYAALLTERGLALDVYYQPAFLKTVSLIHEGEFEVFVHTSGPDTFIYPYVLLPFTGELEGYFDITSPYGYCGPYCSSDAFFDEGEDRFLEHAKNHRIVSEFIRYHYLYNKQTSFRQGADNIFNREIVLLSLSDDWETIWMKHMSGTNRNIVRKLRKEGYQVEVHTTAEHLPEFVRMYNATMQNVHASDFFFFSDCYYHQLFAELGNQIFLARVVREGITFCTALFFESAGILTYFLSARNLDFTRVPSTNLLLTEVAERGHKRGNTLLNFGGGRTAAPDDALFKFKSNFGQERGQFYIGKRIHSQQVYRQLQQEYITRHGQEQYDAVRHLLHFYR